MQNYKKYFISKRQIPYLIFEIDISFMFIIEFNNFEIICNSKPLYSIQNNSIKSISGDFIENQWILRKNTTQSANFGDSIMIKQYRSYGLGLIMMNEMIKLAKMISPSSSISFKLAGDPTGKSMDDCRKENLERRNNFYRKFGFSLSFKDLKECNGTGSIDRISNLNTFTIQEFKNIELIDMTEILRKQIYLKDNIEEELKNLSDEFEYHKNLYDSLEKTKNNCIKDNIMWKKISFFFMIVIGCIILYFSSISNFSNPSKPASSFFFDLLL